MANITCENCNGRGRVPVETDEICENCSGTGMQSSKAWTFHLIDMEVAKSKKGRHGTTMRFVTEGIEVVIRMDDEWPTDRDPPPVGSRYSIDFRSLEGDE